MTVQLCLRPPGSKVRTNETRPGAHFRNVVTVLQTFRKIAKSVYYLRHVGLSVCLSAWHNWATVGRVFMKFECFAKNLSRKFKLH